MIVTNLIGGLGNQMFQYAAGLALAHRYGVPLRLDLRTLSRYRLHHGYQLDQIFKGDFRHASKLDLLRVLGTRALSSSPIGYDVAPHFRNTRPGKIIRQPTQNYWPGIELSGRNSYLSGYWQSEKYFADVRDMVKSAFTFREAPTGQNLELTRQMEASNSVSVHIRLGDYRTNAETARFHGLCGPEYYARAVNFIREQILDARFFVFSDEPDLARQLLPQEAPLHIISGNMGPQSYRDMLLMACCRHHIIANSTFSWWGAWLAEHTEQIVVAPREWFAGSDEPMNDIYLPNWHRI
jgi:hypothetical protein